MRTFGYKRPRVQVFFSIGVLDVLDVSAAEANDKDSWIAASIVFANVFKITKAKGRHVTRIMEGINESQYCGPTNSRDANVFGKGMIMTETALRACSKGTMSTYAALIAELGDYSLLKLCGCIVVKYP